MDNCPNICNPGRQDSNGDGVGDACTFVGGTSAGGNSQTDFGYVIVKYENVSQAGTTELMITGTGPAADSAGFNIVPSGAPVFYNVSTDASHQGSIELCIRYRDSLFTLAQESLLTLLHFDGVAWHNTSTVTDVVANTVCGVASSLSPFALALPTFVCDCSKQGDINGDLALNVFDVIGAIGIAFSGEPDPQDAGCPTTRGDDDNNGVTDAFDVIYLTATAFSGGPDPINPCTP